MKVTSNCFSIPVPKGMEGPFRQWLENFQNKHAQVTLREGEKMNLGGSSGVLSFVEFATPFDDDIEKVAEYFLSRGFTVSLDAWLSEQEVMMGFNLMEDWPNSGFGP